jgi:8-oxo-dGTP diphosphatase
MRWLPATEVRALLTHDQDRIVLDAALAGPLRTRPVVLVRHASAGKKGSFDGRDVDRPLDERGEAQAASLIETFAGYRISRVVSADVKRCLDTVAPLARARDLPVEPEPLFSAAGFADRPRRTVKRLLRLSDEPADVDEGVVVCSQREVIGDLLAAALRERRVVPTVPLRLAKGEFWVSHLRGDRIIAVERWPAVRPDRAVDPAAHLSLHPGRR